MDLLVLAKEPVPGRVKTRLTPPCTPEAAAAIAAAALADTLTTAMASSADRVVVAMEGSPGPWCPAGVTVVPQGDGLLADRLAVAWSATAGPALQIGMDTPQVSAALLDEAMAALMEDACDAVLGPAEDGGWWAIGLRDSRPEVFRGIETSRADTGARQLERLASDGLRTTLLAPQRDVDTWDDALEIASCCTGGAFAAAVDAARRELG